MRNPHWITFLEFLLDSCALYLFTYLMILKGGYLSQISSMHDINLRINVELNEIINKKKKGWTIH